jgi:hypothetical protein
MSDTSSSRGPNGQFLPGHSGNPAGKPPGTREKDKEAAGEESVSERECA